MFADLNTSYSFFRRVVTEHPLGVIGGTGNPKGNKTDKVSGLMEPTSRECTRRGMHREERQNISEGDESL